jgi:hypothetical protein
MNKITPGQTLTARSICDSNCIFSVEVTERKGRFATVRTDKGESRKKIYADNSGNEYLYALGKYSMAPIFRAPENKK